MISAHAKINLFLLVGDKQQNGYHQLVSLVSPISLSDQIEVMTTTDGLFSIECSLTPRLASHSRKVCGEVRYLELLQQLNSPDNLALRAAKLFVENIASDIGVKVVVKKDIPMGAGLGGGSSDAAAVLRELNRLTDLPLTEVQLQEIGFKLGSDIPQAIIGKPLIFSGTGELLERVDLSYKTFLSHVAQSYSLVVIKPTFSVATKDAYQRLARGAVTSCSAVTLEQRAKPLRDLWLTRDFTASDLSEDFFANDFQSYVEECGGGDVLSIKKIAKEEGAVVTFMSGSGSAFISLFASDKCAQIAAERIRASLGSETFVESASFICNF